MKPIIVRLMALLLAGCSEERPVGACGESFCIPADATLLSKRTPVEDFNLYEVAWRGERFTIYEGNHPQGQHDTGTAIGLPGNRAGTLRIRDGDASLVFDTQLNWPAYIDVMGRCSSADDCPVKSLARAVTFRT